MKILIIAPHPDDEVLGCGGTIAKYASRGDLISVCYVTKAYSPDWSSEYLKERKLRLSNQTLLSEYRIDMILTIQR